MPGASVTLHLEKLWSQNITITTRLVDALITPMLLKIVLAGQLQPTPLITHHFALTDILQAYDTFVHAGREPALRRKPDLKCKISISQRTMSVVSRFLPLEF
jgi:alcohol dehydrogenase